MTTLRGMGYIVLLCILAIGPLALRFGVDSRIDREVERRRFSATF